MRIKRLIRSYSLIIFIFKILDLPRIEDCDFQMATCLQLILYDTELDFYLQFKNRIEKYKSVYYTLHRSVAY